MLLAPRVHEVNPRRTVDVGDSGNSPFGVGPDVDNREHEALRLARAEVFAKLEEPCCLFLEHGGGKRAKGLTELDLLVDDGTGPRGEPVPYRQRG